MKVLIVGAGLMGVSTAWFLAQAGCDVTVLERQDAVAQETSFANGGQVSVSHSEPWATPHNLRHALGWLGRADAPLLLKPHWSWQQWFWLAQFVRECLPHRVQHNVHQMVSLARYSREVLSELSASLCLNYDADACGILHFYEDKKLYQHALKQSELMNRYGCERLPCSADACLSHEPLLASLQSRLVGGTFTAADGVGDARMFAQALAEHCKRMGVKFLFGHQVGDLILHNRAVIAIKGQDVHGQNFELDCQELVLAAGSYTPLLTKKMGFYVPIYPGKGYSLTYHDVPHDCPLPRVSLIDEASKIVMTRLGNRLRVAGTAELNGYNLDLTPARLRMLKQQAERVMPHLTDLHEPEPWCGLRPSTPSNVPLIGKSPCENVWLNAGHGTLGWTMAAGSGKLLADLMTGHQPQIAWGSRFFMASSQDGFLM